MPGQTSPLLDARRGQKAYYRKAMKELTMARWLAAAMAILWGIHSAGAVEEGAVLKRVLPEGTAAPNLLRADNWQAYEHGFVKTNDIFSCRDKTGHERSGLWQRIELNQKAPQPIIASAWSRAENVAGGRDSDYSLYLDLEYSDGTPLWGQTAEFATGTHDFQKAQVTVVPEKPVKSVSFYLLLRGHPGRAFFRDAALRVMAAPQSGCVFDGVPVAVEAHSAEGFQIRDVAAGGDFVHIEHEAVGIRLESRRVKNLINVTVRNVGMRDRAVTLIYAIPLAGDRWKWLASPRRRDLSESHREYMTASAQDAGMGRLSRYPFAAVANGRSGVGLGINMERPAFFRVGFNYGTHELFLAYDIGLSKEKPEARVVFCKFGFDPHKEFRGALAAYYNLFPDQFQCRTPDQGLWMPFARISRVRDWQDFGFKFKEGDDETAWDAAHGIITFRYTEPMTWWMPMAKNVPRTMEAALAEAARLARAGDEQARALATSGFFDFQGQPVGRIRDEPWCNGVVWSMNSMPGIVGQTTDFKSKWNASLQRGLDGPKGDKAVVGEYIDSSEGYVTDTLDFRRDHFAVAETPLTFSPDSHQPAIYRGLIAFEYARSIARDVHAMNKLMMANATPAALCWLAPWLDVMGTETDWNSGGKWNPMDDEQMLYRRALCRGKPFCFLMNTDFSRFSHEEVELYMKRCLAYGMFPGFFSANAATGQYFEQPALYDRDRALFRKSVPLCQRVAEAGWEPVTRALSSDEKVYVERFGTRYLTVLNANATRRSVTVTCSDAPSSPSRELVSGVEVAWANKTLLITLNSGDVAVIELTHKEVGRY